LSLLINFFLLIYLKPVFEAQNLIFPYAIHPFDICAKYPEMWKSLKIIYIIFSCFSIFLLINFLNNLIFHGGPARRPALQMFLL